VRLLVLWNPSVVHAMLGRRWSYFYQTASARLEIKLCKISLALPCAWGTTSVCLSLSKTHFPFQKSTIVASHFIRSRQSLFDASQNGADRSRYPECCPAWHCCARCCQCFILILRGPRHGKQAYQIASYDHSARVKSWYAYRCNWLAHSSGSPNR
jgi:hypothetical protein